MFKDLCREIIYKMAASNSEKIKNAINCVDYVSFDVFDTLVKRNLAEPKDVFTYLEQKINADGVYPFDHFANARIEAEEKAHKEVQKREITLQDIYSRISLHGEQKDYYMRMECQAELELSTVNLEMKPLYDYCVSTGKRIYYISDMYLPEEAVMHILHKNGYNQGKLFVSSRSGFTKYNGKLFEYVRDKERIDVSRWIHIGDSITGDYLVPKRFGIKPVLIERNHQINKYVKKRLHKEDSAYRQLSHFIDVHMASCTDPYERIGYAVLGPLLYGFVMWLNKEIPADETIVFLAREGALLKHAFEIVSNRPSVYLRVSRHAINCVRIDNADDVDSVLAERIDAVGRFSNQRQWAKMYGMTDEDIRIFFTQHKLQEEETVNEDDIKKKRLLTSIWPVIKKNVKGQYDLFSAYIRQLGLSEKCAIVDIGWQGTMQTLLSNLRLHIGNGLIQWKGYYLGIHPPGQKPPFSSAEKKAYLYNGLGDNYQIMETVIYTTSFMESLFLSSDGTTLGYEQALEGIRPVLGNADNSGEIARRFFSIQKAGIEFVKDMAEASIHYFDDIAPVVAIANYEVFAKYPSLSTLKLFQNSKFYDEDAVDLVGGQPLWQYVVCPKQFIADYYYTKNRLWFLKNVFKIPFPYMSLIHLARNVTGKGK